MSFAREAFHEKLKQDELVNKSDISNLVKSSELHKVMEKLPAKA